MNNLLDFDFRKELLRTDIKARNLNYISKKYKQSFCEDLEKEIIHTEEVKKCQCGCNDLEELTKIDRFGLSFGSFICKNCGLVSTSPRISEESLPYYYDKYYHPLNYGKENLESQAVLFEDGQGKKIFNILEEYLPNKKTIKVLEIGAGTGSVLKEFKREAKSKNIKVFELGTEYSKECIRRCKDSNINMIQGNIKTVIELKEKYDVIILSHVFEHFTDLKNELECLKQLMTKDSLLYIEVPGIFVNHKKHYYNFSFLGYLVHAHMYNFSLGSLNNILFSNGFECIYGNEEVETIYKLGEKLEFCNNDEYKKIMHYLEFLEHNKDYLLENFEISKQLNIKILKSEKQVENRNKDIEKNQSKLENRDAEIIKLSKQVENRNKDIEKNQSKLENRDAEIIKLSKQVENRNKDIEKNQSKLENRDAEIIKLSKQVEKYEYTLKHLFEEKNPIKKYSIYKTLKNMGIENE